MSPHLYLVPAFFLAQDTVKRYKTTPVLILVFDTVPPLKTLSKQHFLSFYPTEEREVSAFKKILLPPILIQFLFSLRT